MLNLSEWRSRPLLVGCLGLILGMLSGFEPWLAIAILPLALLVWDLKAGLAALLCGVLGFLLRPIPQPGLTESQLFYGEVVVASVPRTLPNAVLAEADSDIGRIVLRLAPYVDVSLGDRLLVQGVSRPPRPYQKRSGFIGEVRSAMTPQTLKRGSPVWRWGGTIRKSFERFLTASLPERQAPLVDALCFGVTTGMSDEDLDLIRASGGAHLIAASGANVVFLLGMVWALVRWVPFPLWLRAPILALVLVVYAGAAGLNPPITRAVIMALIMGGAVLAEREPDLLNALAGAGFIGLIINPWEVISPSFWLSFAAVAGLVLFAPASRNMIVSSFVASFAASAATAPLVGYWFGSIPLAGVLVTLLTGPLALILMGFSLLSWLVWLVIPSLGSVLGLLCEGMASWMLLVFVQFGGPWSLSLPVPEFSPWWLGPFYLLGILMAKGTKAREGQS